MAGFFATSYVGQHKTQGQPELVEEVWSVFTLLPPDMDHWNSELDCFQITVNCPMLARCLRVGGLQMTRTQLHCEGSSVLDRI